MLLTKGLVGPNLCNMILPQRRKLHRSHPQASDHCNKAVGILIRCLCWRCKKLGHYNLQVAAGTLRELMVHHIAASTWWFTIDSSNPWLATLGWPEDCERNMLPHKESNMMSRFPVGPIFFQSWPTLEHIAEADSQCSTIVLQSCMIHGIDSCIYSQIIYHSSC